MAAISGRKKAAILCVSLGSEHAAEIFKHLPAELVEQLTVEMARTPVVEPSLATKIIEEAVETAYARGYLAEGGLRYAREVLERAVGQQRANEIISRLSAVIELTPFQFLRNTPADQIHAFLRNEHPQTIALVVAQLPSTELAARVVELFEPEEQADIAVRIALMGQTSPEVVKEVAQVMEHKLETVLARDYETAGGVRTLAEILNSANRGTERIILEALTDNHREVAEEVRRLLFVFEDILKLDDRAVQLVLKDIDAKELALAMRGASTEVKEKILSHMSQRGAEMLREEMEYMPPQRRVVIEEAQSKIVATVRRLEDAGELTISRGGANEDDVVV